MASLITPGFRSNQSRMSRCSLLGTIVLCGVFLGNRVAATLQAPSTQDGSAQVQVFPGVSRWHIFPNLWVDKSVNITCPGSEEFHTYVAYDPDALKQKLEKKETAWCGWQNLLLVKDSCVARLSPFGTAHVLVVPRRGRKAGKCTFEESQSFSLFMLGQGVLGTLLYTFATPLSASMFFRLTTGSIGFMLLSVLIVLFIISRSLPSKKSVAALVAVFGSSVLTGVRFFFGQWIPSLHQLIYNKVVISYLLVSGVIGWAVTYYFDSEDNVKLHVILKYGLKLLGLAMVATSTSMPEVSLAVCCALLLGEALHSVALLFFEDNVKLHVILEYSLELLGLAMVATSTSMPEVSLAVCCALLLGEALHSVALLFLERMKQKRALREARAAAEEAARAEAIALLAPPPETSHMGRREGVTPATSARDPLRSRLKMASEAPFPDSSMGAVSLSTQRVDSGSTGTPNTGYGTVSRGHSSAYDSGEAQQESPLVRRGLIVNERTGKTIKIGAATYNKLLLEGFDVDLAHGIMTPPRTTSASSPPEASPSLRSVPSASPGRRRSRYDSSR